MQQHQPVGSQPKTGTKGPLPFERFRTKALGALRARGLHDAKVDPRNGGLRLARANGTSIMEIWESNPHFMVQVNGKDAKPFSNDEQGVRDVLGLIETEIFHLRV